MAIMKFENISFSYTKNSNFILKEFTRAIYGASTILVLGDNGSGKSTFGKLACGLLLPQNGKILIEGKDVYNMPPKIRIKEVFYLSQFSQLQILHNSLGKEIEFTKRIANSSDAKINLEEFNLPTNLNFNPFELSVNQMWRFSLYLSTIVNAKCLFIDEIPSISNPSNLFILNRLIEQRKAANFITFIAYQRKIKKINFQDEIIF